MLCVHVGSIDSHEQLRFELHIFTIQGLPHILVLCGQRRSLSRPRIHGDGSLHRQKRLRSNSGVWDINWPSVTAFLDCENQWRIVAGFGFAVRVGLAWDAVEILLKRRGLGDAEFEDILVMEKAALKIFSEAAN